VHFCRHATAEGGSIYERGTDETVGSISTE
jgi:hypothetical protein